MDDVVISVYFNKNVFTYMSSDPETSSGQSYEGGFTVHGGFKV